MAQGRSSFLGLEGLHALVTGSAGGVGIEVVRELLDQGCRVTAVDLRPFKDLASTFYPHCPEHASQLQTAEADISSEQSIATAIETAATSRFGPINVLIANAGIYDNLHDIPIWEMPMERFDRINNINFRGTFLTIKHFLASAKRVQDTAATTGSSGHQLDNLAIVLTGSETGVFGLEGHADYATGKAGLQYGLVKTVKNEIVRLNDRGRINAVAPGLINTPMIAGVLNDEVETWAAAHSTVALKKIAAPADVARAIVFLASHRAAGHITGQVLSCDGGQEGRLLHRQPSI